ncbi:MAG: ABC transporter permease [Clostridia bacterium]|nr:ABC transporter permease [Clostridia bacterium]
MKSYIYLTKKYIKSYPKRCIGIMLCLSLFLFAFLTILWYSDSYQYSLTENDKIKNGKYETICFYADENDMQAKSDELLNEKAGIINGLWTVKNEKSDNIWIGNADENISRILSLHFLSGKMPTSENEIAIEKSTYDILALQNKTGDTIELEVKDTDGKTKKKSFVLTGIIDNFSDKIKTLYDYQYGEISFPTILTVNNNAKHQYTHIFSEKDSFLMRNIKCQYKYFNSSREELASKFVVNRIVILPIQIFFVLTTIIGVASISVYFFKEQESYLNLLRCLGFSKKKSRKLLLIQGFVLWLGSLIISTIGSVIVLLFLKLISSFTTQPLFLNLNPTSLILTALLVLAVITITFNILIKKFYKNAPLRETIYMPKKQRKSETNLNRCWHKAYSCKYRLQNLSCIMIVLFCVGISIFGSFIPLFNARGATFDNPDNFPDNSDYSLHMTGGTSNQQSYYINFPVGCGISHEMADKIISDSRVKVLNASVSHLCVPFFLTTKNPENKLLHKYVIEATQQGYNYIFEHKNADKMIRLAGGDSSKEQLIELPVKWQSYDSILNNTGTITDGKIDEKGYKNGFEIIAPDELCLVGDEFTMIVPIADKGATEQNIEKHIKFKTAKVKVAATYSGSELIISTEYLFSIYPNMNYENLVIQNLDHNDKIRTEELEQNLQTLTEISVGVKYDNYAEMSRVFYTQVNSETLQIIVSVFIFIVVIIIAIIFLSYVQVRSNLRSYILMRAIGAKIETVQRLIINEIYHTLNIGIISGTICGVAVVAFLSVIGSYIKLWDIYLFYVAPVFISTVILLYVGSRMAVKRAVGSMIKPNIIENLNTTE